MKKKINEKNELMKKRSLIVEGEREEFNTPKFYLLETEDVNIGIIKLVTKYRAGLEGIIQKITSNLENVDEFCKNPKAAGGELKVLIYRLISADVLGLYFFSLNFSKQA